MKTKTNTTLIIQIKYSIYKKRNIFELENNPIILNKTIGCVQTIRALVLKEM